MNKIIAYWIVAVDSVVFLAQHAYPRQAPLTWIDVAFHLGGLVLAGVIAFPTSVMPLLSLIATVIPTIRLSAPAPKRDPAKEPDVERDDERGP